ncbi:MAG TPA: hypothetical protein VJ853_04020, partial [Thermoanaerobaculia bacterium]|nr:hypothetical protein [Thermoanaerobaculia bacterium]
MLPARLVWIAWAGTFFLAWLVLFAACRRLRWIQLIGSAVTAPLAMTEFLFYGYYWRPPTLFHLGERFHIDVESFVFCFAIGGISAVLYNAVMRGAVAIPAYASRFQRSAQIRTAVLVLPFVLYPLVFIAVQQPMRAGWISLAIGIGLRCSLIPSMQKQTLIGGLLFLAYYLAEFALLRLAAPPGYISEVWMPV